MRVSWREGAVYVVKDSNVLFGRVTVLANNKCAIPLVFRIESVYKTLFCTDGSVYKHENVYFFVFVFVLCLKSNLRT